MVIRWGRNGEFLACEAYPECKTSRNFVRAADGTVTVVEDDQVEETCDSCGRPMQVRFGRFGKFLGCTGYPECKNVKSLDRPKPTGVRCPDCQQGEILEKRSRNGRWFFSCSRYPDCRFATWERPVPEPCPKCGAPFVLEKTTKRAGTVRRCFAEGCSYRETVEESASEMI
jgi:DNA topoisomerase-1